MLGSRLPVCPAGIEPANLPIFSRALYPLSYKHVRWFVSRRSSGCRLNSTSNKSRTR